MAGISLYFSSCNKTKKPEIMKKLTILTAVIAVAALTGCNSDKNYKLYYASGNLAQILSFSSEMHNGEAIRFRDNAEEQVWEVITFVDNKKEGKWSKYFENGQMMVEEEYANDQLNGSATEWYASGQIKSLKYFKDGQLDGECFAWLEDGTTRSQTVYDKGQLAEETNPNEENAEIAQLITSSTIVTTLLQCCRGLSVS